RARRRAHRAAVAGHAGRRPGGAGPGRGDRAGGARGLTPGGEPSGGRGPGQPSATAASTPVVSSWTPKGWSGGGAGPSRTATIPCAGTTAITWSCSPRAQNVSGGASGTSGPGNAPPSSSPEVARRGPAIGPSPLTHHSQP